MSYRKHLHLDAADPILFGSPLRCESRLGGEKQCVYDAGHEGAHFVGYGARAPAAPTPSEQTGGEDFEGAFDMVREGIYGDDRMSPETLAGALASLSDIQSALSHSRATVERLDGELSDTEGELEEETRLRQSAEQTADGLYLTLEQERAALAASEREVARLTEENANKERDYIDQSDRATRAEREVARLREALISIAADTQYAGDTLVNQVTRMKRKATAALASSPTTERPDNG